MRVAFVAPRWGEQIVGGAEAAMRMIAERVVSMLGWQVEALTSCCSDYMRWSNDLAEGEQVVNGVRVRRFAAAHPRRIEFDIASDRLLAAPARAGLAESARWLDLQGPVCPELLEALAASDADVVALSPYLYHPAVRGIEVVSRRSILHPAAHDEPPIYLPVFRDLFAAAAGLVFYTDWERSFVGEHFRVASTPQLTLGIGVDDPAGAGAGARGVAAGAGVLDRLGLGGRPYVCCLGRVDAGKGTSVLAEQFAVFKERHPGPLLLVFVGPVVTEPPAHPDIVVAGQVDEDEKWALLDGSLALVSPSPFESFSIVLLEAWSRRRPAIVNAHCAATSEHCRRSGAGVAYGSPAELEEALVRVTADPEWRAELGERGRAYVDRYFRWPDLIERWGRLAEQVAERAS